MSLSLAPYSIIWQGTNMSHVTGHLKWLKWYSKYCQQHQDSYHHFHVYYVHFSSIHMVGHPFFARTTLLFHFKNGPKGQYDLLRSLASQELLDTSAMMALNSVLHSWFDVSILPTMALALNGECVWLLLTVFKWQDDALPYVHSRLTLTDISKIWKGKQSLLVPFTPDKARMLANLALIYSPISTGRSNTQDWTASEYIVPKVIRA